MLNPSTAERLALPKAIAPTQAAAEYWKTTLSDAPELLELPTDHPRPARQDHAGASVEVELDEELSAGVEALSRRHGATPYMTLLAGWAVVLSRLSGQADVVIGTPAPGRGHRETEGPAGFAANLLAIRVDLSGAPTVAELLERVKERALGARHHQDISFEQVVELLRPARSLPHHPLFQVTFAWRNTPRGDGLSLPAAEAGGGLAGDVDGVGPESSHVQAAFDLSLALGEREGRIAGSVTYATALFERATVERWVGYLRRVLEEMAADDSRRVERLELMPGSERTRVLEAWNRTGAEHPADACVHHLVQAQAARTPHAVAVAHEDRTLTYGELNARANRLAHHLSGLGVGADARVALCVERGPEMVVGMLAVLKAGGAYVPLDPAYPDERLRYMLADSRPAVLLAPPGLAERFAGSGVPILDPADESAWAHHPDTDPRPAGHSPDHLCYVIYTSGSTGRPKGVAVPHRGVLNLVRWHQRAYAVTADDRATQFASPAFDAAAWETWPYLASGAELHLLPAAVRAAPGALLGYFSRARITLAFLPTPVAEAVLDEIDRLGSPTLALRALLTGGDVLHRGPGAAPFRLVNHYGPTESSVVSTAAEVPADGAGAPPIGLPIDNQTAYVLDGWMNPVPVGVAGELWVGGAGLARGYLGRPALTAERFVPDPFGRAAGGRLYRTGDRVSRRADGVIEYRGRTDFQVKVRGFRIELGEIEAGLRSHHAVRDAVVLAREDAPGEKRLVAYVVGDAEAETLRAHLTERLPEYMVPASYVALDRLPLTPNGKVDRKALLAPGGDAFAPGACEAPESEAERAVAGIWSEVLGVTAVSRRASFFDLGGHSLLAAQVISRVRQALGAEVAPGELFDHPVLADFARVVESAARVEMPAIEPVDRREPLALSFAQQRLWFMEQLGGAGSGYHIPWRLRLRGELDRAALDRALDRVVARHESLRTTFAAVDGQPVQRIAPVEESAFHRVEHDLRGRAGAEAELLRLADEESAARFDLERGPLFRGRLVRMADDDHVLLLTLHHVVSDGWSMGVLADELGALYAAFRRGEADPLPPLPVQYADFAAWQRRWVHGPVVQRQAAYWSRALSGAPERLELPTDRPRPAWQDHAGASLSFTLGEELTAGLNALSRRNGTTLFMTVLAGWAAVLGRLSGQDDVVVGAPAANRGRREIEGLIGFFVNPLALRVDLSGSPTVAELMARAKARALEAQRNQDIPFEQVVERVRPARSRAHHPLFQVMLAWQNAPAGRVELPGLEPAPVAEAPHEAAQFDLSLELTEEDGRLAGGVTYATALFDRATVERHVGYLLRALEAMCADEGRPVKRLPLLPDAERARVVEEWNATDAEYPRELCVHELFEARVKRTPDAVAVAHEGGTLTYSELNRRANRLAHPLRALGVGPDVRVAVCVERGVEMVVGVLAVLKAGGAYVPLDPAYPAGRLRYMLEDSAPAVLLARAALAGRFAGVEIPVVALDADASGWADGDDSNPERAGLTPDHLAYVIYTSGSTGRPKGAMVEHRGVCNLALAQIRGFAVEPGSRVLQFASFSFDACVSEIFTALCAGASLYLPPRGVVLAGDALLQALAADAITHVTLSPAVLGPLADDAGLGSVQTLVVAGDVATGALVKRWAPGRRLINAYGPTEATVCATMGECGAGESGNPPIGRPIANVRTYVLDGAGEPVPAGVVGELYVGGAGVARGYLGRPGLTAERFVPDPFGGTAGARLYRTGDLARWLAYRALEFVGRADGQVKVRGFRVETGEIETRLAEHPDVREAAVLAREDARGDRRLVAYWVGGEVAAQALRAHLAERLPEYMVPAAYVRMDALPLTPNGKLDRAALPAPQGDAFAARAYEAPASEAERAVAEIWSELLGVERVGRGDHFFELGGHSLLAVQVGSRVRRALGAEVAPGELFERPVLADFARRLEAAEWAETTSIAPVDRGEPLALSFAQQRLWFLEQLGGIGAAYHIPMRLRLRGELDRGALVRALDRIVARHEALRTSFAAVDGEPVQHIAPVEESGFRLVEHDLRASADAEAALRRLVSDEASASFDLALGPLIRGRLVRMAADDHVLLLTMHHIVSDGWSAGVLFREMGALYAAFVRGEPDPLPPLPVQYADYAAWHRRRVEGPVLEAQAEYWTRTLAGAPELLELPADRPRPPRQDFAGASLQIELDEALSAALRTVSQRHGTTLFITLLAGWAAVLARLSGQGDIVIGTPSANRGRAEVDELIGFFVTTLPVRVDLSEGPRVGELLEQVKARALEAQRNQDIPFEQVVERLAPTRSLAYSPLFQVMFAWQNAPGGDLSLPGLAVAEVAAGEADTAKFDLTLSLWEQDGRIAGTVEYATALYEQATVARFIEYLRRVLAGMAADDAARVDGIPILPTAERTQVVEAWNATDAAYPAEQCIHQRFEAQAVRTPQSVAVSHDADRVTYAELNARANRLAHYLRRRGVGPEVRVAICMERGVEMVVSMLAILKAGGAWVPLDPAHPVERLSRMLSNSGAALLLTQDRLRAKVPADASTGLLAVDAEWAAIEAESAENPQSGATPAGLAYVIYTSGSTGTPKGVGIEHRALVNHMAWFVRDFGVTAGDRVLQKTPVVFDASVWEFHAPLLVGGELVMARHEGERDPRYLARTLRDRGITVLQLVPSLLRVLLDEPELAECTSLRHLFCGGEPLPGELVRRAAQILPALQITNLYGPAECCIDTSTHLCGDADSERAVVPIGRPVSNTRSYVLDAALRPVPVGVPGELCIGGVQVGRGYLGRAALTAERFVPDPFGAAPGARLYCTGDRVRWSAAGELEFLGRTDFQVKIRGVRIELGEIEAALRDHDAVCDAIVLARADEAGEKRLVAYVVGDADVDVDALRAHLAARVPAYMVPAAYVRLDVLPLTPNGKLDRKALPAPAGDAFATRGYEAPAGETEQAVAAIWAELLGAERVGRGDDFFHLGGHSLLTVRVVSRVRQALDVDVSPGDLFERPVLADFARGLQTAARAVAAAITPVDRTGTLPPSFAQQRLWFLEQMGNLGSTYHIPVRLRLNGALDRDALVRALDRIVARHEALRTTFPTLDGEPIQHVVPAEESAFRLVEHDLRAAAEAEAELPGLMRDEMAAPFDLAHGPLIRGRLVRMADDDHVLLLTMHHIVSDGWSAGVLHRELGALYAAFARGSADPLPPLPIQYADYAAWHRRSVEGDVLEAQAAYWTETLGGAPELIELPADHPRPPRQDFAGASLQIELDEGLTAALKMLGQRHGATLHMTLLAGWAAVLARLSGQDDVVVGTPSANRGQAEIEGLIGFFVNMLPLRVDLSGAPSVVELLGRVKERSLGAQRHQDIPFEQVVERVQPVRSLAHTPLFQVLFAWQDAARESLELPGLTVGPLDPAGFEGSSSQVSAKFDLSLDLWEDGGRIEGVVDYATALFERETVERWLGYLRRVLEGMVADERGSVERLDLLSAAERRRVVEEWNATDAAFPAGACVHELFEAQAARAPDAVAVVWEDETLSYAALDHAASRLANHLRRRGVRPETRVAICLERGTELIVSILAVLKAGGAYVPLDPAYPAERLAFMLTDSGAPLLLTRLPLPEGLAPHAAEVVCLDADRERIEAESAQAPAAGALPGNLAYVIYTSGSTGTPKGVMVPHRGVPSLAYAQARRFGIDGTSRILQFASFSFDAAVAEVFDALLAGATLVMASREALLPGAGLLETLRRGRVTVATLPPSVLAMLPPDDLPELRTIVSAGEAVDAATVARWSVGRSFVNAYGPTEVTVCATSARCEPDGRVPAIGRGLENVRVYVLDAAGRPAPVGVPGELYVGGVGVARGYLGRSGLTAGKFVPDPFSGEVGARLYRTGDRVRWSARGELEYLGRVDEQVKVRGFRIEPGEIEARLVEHAGVREAVVLVREDAPGEKRLVAYVAGDETAGAEVLRAHLSERLPEYMVPAAYVRLETLPLTPNGKVDRRALPAPEGDAFATRGYEAPSGQAEQAVAAIWAELLGAERVGRGDHFFELGGHSLLAVRVASRVRQALGVEALPRDVFERPVLADFARGLETAARAEATVIVPVERSGPLALSFAQQRLWFLEQLGNLGSTYHIPMSLRLRGELDRGALVRSLDRIIARHEALRTSFPTVDGEPIQHIAPVGESGLRLAEHDLRASPDAEDELRRLVSDEASALFDLARGPLVRGRLLRVAADDHVLLLTMHHIVSDGWSAGVLHRELSSLYAAFARGEPDPLPPLPVQYADYAAWHRRRVEGPVLEAQAEYWTRTLAGAPELLELPADRPRPSRQDFAGASLQIELDEALSAALRTLSQRHGTTLFMTLLAGWASVLSRLSGQDDVVIGTPSANRAQPEVEELIGFFVNTLLVRVELSGSPTVAELLGQVRARALEAQQNQDIPFEQVVELLRPARSLAYSPLCQALFTWQSASGESLELPGLQPGVVPESARETAKFDLTLTLAESGDRIVGELNYATALFDRATAERFSGYLRRVLAEMAADGSRRMERLALMPDGERSTVLEEWNRTEAGYPARSSLHALFEAQVERTPDAVAVTFQGQALTYAGLNARANRLAHFLAERGVGPDVRVGLAVERSLEMMVGLLAVLKAGGAYVALDPSYPEDRLRYMLADSGPVVLLTQASLAGRFGGAEVPVVALDADAHAWAGRPETNPRHAELTPDHLAYVIYTSGSTGLPKGVMVAHRSVVNVLTWMQGAWGLGAREVVLQKTPYSFDASLRELIPPLLVGARMVMARPGGHRDAAYLLETVRAEQVTTLHFVPSMLQVLVDEADFPRCTSLERVVCGGEALPRALVERFHAAAPGARLFNVYGPTEAAVDVTAWSCAAERGRDGSIPIGAPMANTRLYVLDRAGEPVPVGVAGELYIGGVQVARGYLNRAALTADRFVPDRFGGEAGGRLYRTGDLARWRPDGAVDFLGRGDAQVKVRGYRIELGEIEARLREHARVREAVVLAREDTPGNRRLVAYVVGDPTADAEALRAHLSERLPEYMIPAAYVRLDALPLTPNGKVNRRALPAPDGDAFAARGYEAPSGAVEQAVAAIWAELLGAERVGRHDHFFELGGHSLLAVRVVSRVRRALGVGASPGDVFERPVLADFARGLGMAAQSAAMAIAPVDRGAAIPLSFAQQRLWFLEQLGGTGAAYHVPMRLRLQGDLDRGALERALDRIVARHEALRTSFPTVDGEPVQRIASIEESAFRLVEHDLRASADAEDGLRRLVQDEAGAPFDLPHGPLVRGRLVRVAADDHVLLLTMHHIVSDGWSTGVFFRELGALYAAFARGDADPLPPLPVQYADYAAWHRRWVEGPVLEAQAEYWTETLAGAPELLELPTDHPRPAKQDFAGASLMVELDEELTEALKTLSQRHGTTLFMTLLAGWAAVLARLAGQDEVVIGTPSANRGRSEIEDLIGFFINTLPVRVDLSGAPTVAEALGRVKARALEAQRNQDIPFEQVVERLAPTRSLAYSPLFQVMFAWQNAPGGDLQLPGLAVAEVAAGEADTAKFDLTLSLWEQDGRIAGTVEYATALYEQATVARFVEYLRRVLAGMAADDAARVDGIPILPAAERARVVEAWNATDAAYPAEQCIHHQFEAQAARTPGATAVSHDDERVTYAELNARANRLAHYLRRRGVGPEVRVAICMERGVEMVVSMLAILKAGGAWVPLDPAHPVERLERMLADSGAAVLLTQERLRAKVPADASIGIFVVDAEAPAIGAESAENPESGPAPGSLAYVIYTSGSTGTPKGVGIEHRALVNHMAWFIRDFGVTAGDRVLQKTPVVFDASVWEFYAPLLVGGELVMARHEGERDPRYLARTLRDRGITVLQLVPSLLRVLLDEPELAECTALRHLFCGGEPLPGELVRRAAQVLPGVHITNLYGPAECCIDTITHLCIDADGERAVVPIGRPVSNTRSYVLNAALRPVPVGVPGELCIGGMQVGRGYLGRARLTAERFVPDPFGAERGARLYRTGDRVRWREESAEVRECVSGEVGSGSADFRTDALTHARTGVLEFLGRTDFQVKIRGFRIELGEIEAALRSHDAVRDAVVLAREDAPGDRRLVAYYLADQPVAVEALRTCVAERLPEYMVPAAHVWMEAYPLTPNGKLDRNAFPAPEGDAYASQEYEAPVGETEQAVAAIWADLLGVERVGRHDHFFHLGGNSLLATRLVFRIRREMDVELSVSDVFEKPALSLLARHLAAAQLAQFDPDQLQQLLALARAADVG